MKKKKDKFVLTKEIKIKTIIAISLMLLLFLSFLFSEKLENVFGLNNKLAKNETTNDVLNKSDYSVNYLDVGQGNSAVICLPDGKTVLIDGGNTMYGETVYKFLIENKIKNIDYMIATHADSDHIGGLNYILSKMEVKTIFRPFQISGSGTTASTFVPSANEDLKDIYSEIVSGNSRNKISRITSSVYEEFITKIYSEKYTISQKEDTLSDIYVFYDGLKFSGKNYYFEFFFPEKRKENIDFSVTTNRTKGYATEGYGVSNSNDNSAIFLFSCKNDTYLFTGDASFKNGSSKPSASAKYEESDFVKSLTNDEKKIFSGITVYLAGHHGSSYSTSEELLSLINPRFVVISVGENNTYGHPSSEVLHRLQKTKRLENDYLLRTDKNGNICFGNVHGRVCYVVDRNEYGTKETITWEIFATVIYFVIIFVIFNIKPIKFNGGMKRNNLIDTTNLCKYNKNRR